MSCVHKVWLTCGWQFGGGRQALSNKDGQCDLYRQKAALLHSAWPKYEYCSQCLISLRKWHNRTILSQGELSSHKSDVIAGGRVCSFSPCIEQVQRACAEMRELGFREVQTMEVLLREYNIQTTNLPVVDLGFQGFGETMPGSGPINNTAAGTLEPQVRLSTAVSTTSLPCHVQVFTARCCLNLLPHLSHLLVNFNLIFTIGWARGEDGRVLAQTASVWWRVCSGCIARSEWRNTEA